MGKIGAECDRTFSNNRRSLDKPTWDKERVGMLCTDSSNVANIKAALMKLCGDTGMCTQEILRHIENTSKRIEPIAKKAEEAKAMSLIKRSIKLGDKGTEVAELHKLLFEHGYSSADEPFGDFDVYTENMVKAFQSANGLTPDGVVGSLTWQKLNPDSPLTGDVFKGRGETIIPFAVQHKRKMRERAAYSKGYPLGVLVHYSAGQWETFQHGLDMMNWGISKGYTYLGLEAGGKLIQAHAVNMWGEHAGTSAWTRSLVGSVSDDLIGIEVLNPGQLTKKDDGFYTYFDKKIDPAKHGIPRYVTEKEWGCVTGWYLPFTPAQEATLVQTIIWLYRNDPYGVMKLDNVLGHHEVAGKLGLGYFRKPDPGGALSMPMADFRNMLKRKV